MTAALVFLGGAIYEFAAVVWAQQALARAPLRAALASAVCAACLALGLGETVRTPALVPFFVAGYAVGTWAAVRRS